MLTTFLAHMYLQYAYHILCLHQAKLQIGVNDRMKRRKEKKRAVPRAATGFGQYLISLQLLLKSRVVRFAKMGQHILT